LSQDFASKVIAAAAGTYGVTRSDLISGGYKNCAAARNAAMAIIMDLSPAMQYARLGLIMDGRQRDTVAVGVRAHRKLLADGCPTTLARDRQIRTMLGQSVRSQADVFAAMGL
jgi:chromosomal replication initiation ATPase DnaA